MANKHERRDQERGREATRERDEERERRESGLPGGGEGRQDEVGRTGVYPASGPLPEGDAEIQGMASWGQGERGAAGYDDSGESELWYTESELEEMTDKEDVRGELEAEKQRRQREDGQKGRPG